mmetsp:Transcript_52751/g.120342  ORF Transcript_52751/g.120342 Transcript_52751/m.120342 type:complete len:267 (-) Transcript_52751:64-864(-)
MGAPLDRGPVRVRRQQSRPRPRDDRAAGGELQPHKARQRRLLARNRLRDPRLEALAPARDAFHVRAAVAPPLASDHPGHVPAVDPRGGRLTRGGQQLPSHEHRPGHEPRPGGASDRKRDAQDPLARPEPGGVIMGGAERGASGRQRRAQRSRLHRQIHPGVVHLESDHHRDQADPRALQKRPDRRIHRLDVWRTRHPPQGYPLRLFQVCLRRVRGGQLLRRGFLHRRAPHLRVALVLVHLREAFLPDLQTRRLRLVRWRVPAVERR